MRSRCSKSYFSCNILPFRYFIASLCTLNLTTVENNNREFMYNYSSNVTWLLPDVIFSFSSCIFYIICIISIIQFDFQYELMITHIFNNVIHLKVQINVFESGWFGVGVIFGNGRSGGGWVVERRSEAADRNSFWVVIFLTGWLINFFGLN